MVAAFERAARMPPGEAARRILDGVRRGKRRIVVGLDARTISLLQRLLPVGHQRLIERGVKRRGLTQV